MTTWKTFPVRLERSEALTPTMIGLRFRPVDREFVYKPGQFINIHFEHDGEALHRSYSVATAPGAGIEIAVSPVKGGAATQYLFGLKEGDTLQVSGPYGRFVLRDDPPCRYVLVATGTGVTPYRAMLPELAHRLATGEHTVDLLLGVWRRSELLYGEEFAAFAREHPGFRFHACYSRELPEQPYAYESRGHVQVHYDSLQLDPETDIVYLCGNPDMIDQSVEYLKGLAFPIPRMRREKYVSAK